MNKKLIIGILIVVVGLILYKISEKPKVSGDPSRTVPPFVFENQEYCFGMVQETTADAPYRVEEHISLVRVGDNYSGKKWGTQAGPDMTNGYEGTMTGTQVTNHIELTYGYTIEGSKQKEIEYYLITKDLNLVKERYVLKEENWGGETMLVPDTTSTPTLITYVAEACPEK